MDIVECEQCGERVMLRRDGSCPSCRQGGVVLSVRKLPERDFGRTELKVWEKQLKVEITERGVVAHDLRPPTGIILPNRCVCCDATGWLRDIAIPTSTQNTVALPSCPSCDVHLRPPRRAWVGPTCFIAGAVAFAAWRITDSPFLLWPFLVLLIVACGFAIANDQRRRKPLPMWSTPRDGHCGPLWLFRIGANHTFISHHRSWLRDTRDANAATFDVTMKDASE